MLAKDFAEWRERMHFNRGQAAEALGIGRNTPMNYEEGRTEIPVSIALACSAIIRGLAPYASFSGDVGERILSYTPNKKRWQKALMGEDDMGSIIRCHLEAEQAATTILQRLTQNRYRDSGNSYLRDKLRLCKILGVDDKFIQPLATINELRNDFAHRNIEEITEQKYLDLLRQVRSIYPAVGEMQMTIEGQQKFDKKLIDCNLREKYVIVALVAISLFDAASSSQQT